MKYYKITCNLFGESVTTDDTQIHLQNEHGLDKPSPADLSNLKNFMRVAEAHEYVKITCRLCDERIIADPTEHRPWSDSAIPDDRHSIMIDLIMPIHLEEKHDIYTDHAIYRDEWEYIEWRLEYFNIEPDDNSM